jgi:hypothetical protein
MAHIQKRIGKKGKESFRVTVRRKGQPVQTATFKTKTKAREWGRKMDALIDDGKHFPTSYAKRKTVADMVERYIQNVLPLKGKSTQTHQAHQLGWWKEQIGDMKLSAVSTGVVLEYRDKMLARKKQKDKTGENEPFYKNSTINRYVAALSAALGEAHHWGWIEHHPIRGKIKSLEENKRTRYLNDEERLRLLSACQKASNPIIYDIVMTGICTGSRDHKSPSYDGT